ncbi:hypothetical protein ABFS82_11G128600 [Erythranthe guttata]|uniref:Uncharacterized protein n=1 Tax=Erythranthe guttata TaxID=4155 RepID=A0A022R520_ERYGU|nr:PREDICTED: uncharacterized protein LOC105960870 [Erythranthe guttata]EYU34718.1 hypothetical protein MIMGU_mgv1a014966mg [Erythranthe guttata]|eukprot:XP_012840535.1 PREDICTED: uncharacterized protein LOC105960870 [Erythranthe guttata]
MEDHQSNSHPSPASSSSSSAVVKSCRRGGRRHAEEEDAGDPVACTGKSCQSCTAGVIADCVAVCCCPCAVVNILALAFVKLPWAVARKFIGRRREERKKKMKKRRDTGGISEKTRAEAGTADIVMACRGAVTVEEVNDHFSAEEVWFELYEVGHLGFGRVSFTGIPFQNKGN